MPLSSRKTVSTWRQAHKWFDTYKAANYKGYQTWWINSNHFGECIGLSCPLTKLRKGFVWQEIQTELQNDHPKWSSTTVNHVVSTGKAVINATRKAGLHDVIVPDFDKLPPKEYKEEHWTRSQFAELLDTARSHFGRHDLADAMILGYNLGCRQDNLLKLKVRDVDFEKFHVWIGGKKDNETKAGNCWTVPFEEEVEKVLRRHCEGKLPTELVIGDCFNNRSHLYRQFIQVVETCGYPTGGRQGWDWHTLRHSFATNLAETETPVNIARLTGHKSVNSVLRYAKRQDSQARAAIRRMNEAARVNSVDSDEQLTAKIIEIMAQLKSQGIA